MTSILTDKLYLVGKEGGKSNGLGHFEGIWKSFLVGWASPIFYFMRGFVPARRGTFVSAKVPKTIFARARPHGGSSASAPNKMAQKLAALKQSSPKSRFGAAAPPRPTRTDTHKTHTVFKLVELPLKKGKRPLFRHALS